MGAVDVNGGFPPGFVPQSITDARGRSTPIIDGGVFIPPSPSGGSGLERSGTPAPIYGNPIALQRDKKREEEATAATPPRSQSPVGGSDWSAPLAALHPPIFPVTGHQQPFQHPPPGAGGSWGGGGSTTTNDRLRNEHSPVLSARPFIPGQTSTVGSGGSRNQEFSSPVIPTQPLAGGGTWGLPSRPPSGFGGSTPGPRNQDLLPVIPNPTIGGDGWSTPSRPPSGFGGSTPGPRSQDLPPVIPNSTVGGGGWSTSSRPPSRPPSGFGTGGMTPGPRSQDLPPVVPNSTLAGGWSTPNRPPSGFGGGGMTPGPKSQDLPPVIPNSTVGGGWGTSSNTAGSFGGGAG